MEDDYFARLDREKLDKLKAAQEAHDAVAHEAALRELHHHKCGKCGHCFRACPAGAITWKKRELASIDPSLCVGCGQCGEVCPDKFEAVELMEVS